MDYYLEMPAAVRYPQMAIKYTPKHWGFSVFYDFFGNSEKLIDTMLENGHPFAKIGGVWRYDHNYTGADYKVMTKAGKFAQLMQRKYRKQKIYFNPFIEHTILEPEGFLLHATKAAPLTQIINNPGDFNRRSGGWSHAFLNEIHKGKIENTRGYEMNSFSYDGKDSLRANIGADKKHYICQTMMIYGYWTPSLNLLTSETDHTPVAQRTHLPTVEEFRQLANL